MGVSRLNWTGFMYGSCIIRCSERTTNRRSNGLNLKFIIFLVIVAIIFVILAIALNSCIAEWAVDFMIDAHK